MDVLKVDRAFTNQLGKGTEGEVVFNAIVSVAEALNMCVVAEGVETEKQLEILRKLSCDEIQGYLVAPAASRSRNSCPYSQKLFVGTAGSGTVKL